MNKENWHMKRQVSFCSLSRESVHHKRKFSLWRAVMENQSIMKLDQLIMMKNYSVNQIQQTT